MTRKACIAMICAGAVILIAVVLPGLLSVKSFRPKLEKELSAALGRRVQVGEVSLSVISGTVSADTISIADDPAFSSAPFIRAKSFGAEVKLRPLLFSRTLHVTGIKLEKPEITLLRGPNGTWNVSTFGKVMDATREPSDSAEASSEASSLYVGTLSVTNGRVLVGNEKLGNKPSVYENVNIEVKDFSSTTPFLFAMMAALPGGGDVGLNGTVGPINRVDTRTTPFEATITVRKLNLAASGFVTPSSGVQGIADLDGEIRSANQQVKASGTMRAENLKLALNRAPMKRAVEANYDLNYNLETGAGTLTQSEVGIGKAVGWLNGGYQTTRGRTTLDMKISGSALPVDDLEAALPALGVVLPSGSKLQGGVVSIDLTVSGPSDQSVISGPIRLRNAKLAGFDLGSRMSAIPALSGRHTGGEDTSIQEFSATVRVSPEGVQAGAINIDIPALGVFTGGGTVSSSGALDFSMTAVLSGSPGVIQKTGSAGQGGVSFSVQGTASDPKFVPDMKSVESIAIAGKVTSALPDRPLTMRARRR